MENIVSRKLSVHKEHELLLKLETAGLGEIEAQAVVESKDNRLAEEIVAFIRRRSCFPAMEDVRTIQLARLVKLGYPEAAGMTEIRFSDLIPVPENKKGALLVIPASVVPIDKQMELIAGENWLDLNQLKDLVETPKTPYWIYGVENGKAVLGKSPDDCLKFFKKQGRRGLTVVKGIAIVAQNPDVLKDHYIDLPGSRFGAGRVPCLRHHVDGPVLDGHWSGDAGSYYGSASCGS